MLLVDVKAPQKLYQVSRDNELIALPKKDEDTYIHQDDLTEALDYVFDKGPEVGYHLKRTKGVYLL